MGVVHDDGDIGGGGAAACGARGAAAARVAGARGAVAREQEEEVVNIGRAVAVDVARGVLAVGRQK